MEKIKNLWFDGNRLYMRSSEGRVFSRPLEAYPELEEFTKITKDDKAKNDYRFKSLFGALESCEEITKLRL